MYDYDFLSELFLQVKKAISIINKRFANIEKVTDFTDTETGMMKLDAICLPLMAIGELLNKIDRVTDSSFLPQYPYADWKKAIGQRNIIAHAYFDISAEAVFDTCQNNIPELETVIDQILFDLRNPHGPANFH